jgi:hypothetical protein
MIKIKLFVVALTLAFLNQPPSAFALVAGPAKVVGTVKSFDDKAVIVENEESNFEIPKAFVAEKNLKSGNKIEITLSQEQVDKVKVEKRKTLKK